MIKSGRCLIAHNPNMISILEKMKFDDILWAKDLCRNPNAIYLLEANQDKITIDWYWLSENPAIFTYDYQMIKRRENM
jgi:hypothetical protein